MWVYFKSYCLILMQFSVGPKERNEINDITIKSNIKYTGYMNVFYMEVLTYSFRDTFPYRDGSY